MQSLSKISAKVYSYFPYLISDPCNWISIEPPGLLCMLLDSDTSFLDPDFVYVDVPLPGFTDDVVVTLVDFDDFDDDEAAFELYLLISFGSTTSPTPETKTSTGFRPWGLVAI